MFDLLDSLHADFSCPKPLKQHGVKTIAAIRGHKVLLWLLLLPLKMLKLNRQVKRTLKAKILNTTRKLKLRTIINVPPKCVMR